MFSIIIWIVNYIFIFFNKIITGNNSINYLIERMKLIFTFNKETKDSIKFGLNTAIHIIQNDKVEKDLVLIFIFYKESMNTLINLILLKSNNSNNVKIFLIDSNDQKYFLTLFQLKKLLAFTVYKNEYNSKVIDEIFNNFHTYNSNSNEYIPIYKTNIKEISIEK